MSLFFIQQWDDCQVDYQRPFVFERANKMIKWLPVEIEFRSLEGEVLFNNTKNKANKFNRTERINFHSRSSWWSLMQKLHILVLYTQSESIHISFQFSIISFNFWISCIFKSVFEKFSIQKEKRNERKSWNWRVSNWK